MNCRGPESNRHSRLEEKDFKSFVSTNSTTPAYGRRRRNINGELWIVHCFSYNLIKDCRECKSDIWEYFSIKLDILTIHRCDETAIAKTFCSQSSRHSFYPYLSLFSLLFFSSFVRMLSLFDQCQSYLFIDSRSSESKSCCQISKLFMSLMSLETICYSYH